MQSANQLGLVLLLSVVVLPCYADIYAFVDSNGVRHITNKPDDPRYSRVMETPRYSRPGNPQPSTPVAVAKSSSGWRFYSPKNGTVNYINWSEGRGVFTSTGKPFSVNDNNRARFAAIIDRVARKHRLDPHLVHAVISAESAYNPQAVSSAGAMGLMQLIPATADRFGVKNAFDPESNINGGAQYLRWLLDRFKNVNLALAGYNAGEGAVQKYGNSIPPYKETQTYVKRVMQFYNHYRANPNG